MIRQVVGFVGLVLLCLTVVGDVRAQSPANRPAPDPLADQCVDAEGRLAADVRIGTCTAVLRSGRYVGSDQEFVLVSRGNAYAAAGDLALAIADYDQAQLLLPTSTGARFNRALARLALEQFDQALVDIDAAIQLAPDWAEAYQLRGEIRYAGRDDTGAVADYTRSLELKPSDAAYHGRGVSYLILGDRQRGMADLDEAIRLNPQSLRSLSMRAYAWREQGNSDAALLDYNAALRIEPRNSNLLNQRGALLFDRNALGDAVADFEQLLAINPNDGVAAMNICAIRLMVNEVQTAITSCDRALTLDPASMESRLIRGVAHFRLQSLARAEADFSALLGGPADGLGRYGLALVEIRKGNLVEGNRKRDEALRLLPSAAADFARLGVTS